MATFFGGETITNVVRLNITYNGAAGTFTAYTVPSGVYAKISVHSTSFDVTPGDEGSVVVGDQSLINNTPPYADFTILSTGQTIRYGKQAGASSTSLDILVREFSIP